MSEFSKRIDEIIVPVSLCSIWLGVFYSLFNYVILSKYHLFDLPEEYINIYIPIALSVVFFLIFLRPQIKILDFGERTKSFTTFISLILIIAPLIVSQYYFEMEQGGMSKVSSPEVINEQLPSKYYQISEFYIDKSNAEYYHTSSNWKGKNTLTTYCVAPLLLRMGNNSEKVWMCVKYVEDISETIFDDKDKIEKAIDSIFKNQETKFFYADERYQIIYFKNVYNSEDYKYYLSAVRNITSNENLVLLKPEYDVFEEKKSNLLTWSLAAFLFSNVILFIIFSFLPVNKEKYSKKKIKVKTSLFAKIKEKSIAFLPGKYLVTTIILIYLNILVYLVMVLCGVNMITPDSQSIKAWGGNVSELSLHGEPWRLFTSVFVHVGIVHLLSNACALFYAGTLVELRIGARKTAYYYIICGIAASITSAIYNDNTISAGASGAIMGLFGIFFTLSLIKTNAKNINYNIIKIIALVIVYNLIIGLNGNTDNAAHIGGLLVGISIGLIENVLLRINKTDN